MSQEAPAPFKTPEEVSAAVSILLAVDGARPTILLDGSPVTDQTDSKLVFQARLGVGIALEATAKDAEGKKLFTQANIAQLTHFLDDVDNNRYKTSINNLICSILRPLGIERTAPLLARSAGGVGGPS